MEDYNFRLKDFLAIHGQLLKKNIQKIKKLMVKWFDWLTLELWLNWKPELKD